MDDSTHRYAHWYLGLCAALVLVLGSLNWIVDPLQFYRRARFYEPVFSENQRYQKPGLAKHYPYEIVVVGDSHAENFSPAYIERKLGAPALNLAISGSTAREQYLIVRKAIATGRVRRVLWTLGRMPFRKPPAMVVDQSGEFPRHFYDEGPLTHSRYVLSLDTFRLSIAALRGDGVRDLEALNTWWGEHEFSQRRMLMDWQRRSRLYASLGRDPERRYQPKIERIRENVRENLAAVIRAHPEIEFDVFFPPYSVLSYVIDDRMAPWMFDERLAYKRSVVEELAPLANARVFDFQVVAAITHDLDNYKDLEHYRVGINEYIVDSIAEGRHQVDKARYGEVLETFRAQVAAFKQAACSAQGHLRHLCPSAPVPGI